MFMLLTHGLLLFLLFCAVAAAAAVRAAAIGDTNTLIPFDDASIKYFGRWRRTGRAIQSGWPGAYFKTTVGGGSGIKLRLNRPTSVFVQVDYGVVRQLQAAYQGQLPIELDVTPPPDAPAAADGKHELLVAAATNASIVLESLVISGTVHPPARLSPQLVEFVGHELSLGAGTTQSLFTSFPWLASSLVDAEHAQIAYNRARLESHTRQDLGMETRYFDWSPHDSSAWWDFSYAPAAMVVLLGRNDRVSDDYAATLVTFLKRIRAHLPDTCILILSEPLGDLVRQSQDAVYHLNDHGGDQNIFYVDTTGWVQYGTTAFVDSMHLNDVGHDRMARRLAPLLQARLAIPPKPLPPPPANPSLPHDWQTMDIGQDELVGLPGSVSFDSPHTFTLWGSGVDIGGSQDAFRFVYQSLSGNGAIEATVESHSAFSSCAKAGIMIREHLALGAPHLLFGVSPASGIFVQARASNFNSTRLVKKLRASPPYRFRLVRDGSTWIAQSSSSTADADWQLVANMTGLPLARDVYVGLAVTSCDPAVVSVAKFADISLSGGVGNGFYAATTTANEDHYTPRLIHQHP